MIRLRVIRPYQPGMGTERSHYLSYYPLTTMWDIAWSSPPQRNPFRAESRDDCVESVF